MGAQQLPRGRIKLTLKKEGEDSSIDRVEKEDPEVAIASKKMRNMLI